MKTKTANVTARIEPNIKEQAEIILNKLGIPVSVLIDTLYRQIIITGGIPYSLNISKIKTLDTMTKEEFNEMMQKSYDDEKNGKLHSMEEAIEEFGKVI